jgi:hypothetical protein
MSIKYERRKAQRINCDWPIWFAQGLGKTLYFGQIINISNEALALVCKTDGELPPQGEWVTAYFDVPHVGRDGGDVTTLRCKGCVVRTDAAEGNGAYSQMVIKFERPLLFEPEKIDKVNLLFIVRRSERTSLTHC